ncbi:hypothetical protein BU17DRAFT_66354 [Hysterangium stoloniferum]|nr:hypothetical protein BU17DRAFT_66353 [Hysterangium stoloniferum]KAF8518514.1 hypothetical protein BU17DRAFT_66354 [Hysterangium stoloniferum]
MAPPLLKLLPLKPIQQLPLPLQYRIYCLNTWDGRLSLAPLKEPNPQAILQLGQELISGSGLWAIQAALQFPTACVTAIDLQPIPSSLMPMKCLFTSSGFLKPGGWLVIDDHDAQITFINAGPATAQVLKVVKGKMRNPGVTFAFTTYAESYLAMGVFGEVHLKEILMYTYVETE